MGHHRMGRSTDLRFPRITRFLLIIYLLITTITLAFSVASLYYTIKTYKTLCSSASICDAKIFELYAVGAGVALIAFIEAIIHINHRDRWSIFGTLIVSILWAVVIAIGFAPTHVVDDTKNHVGLEEQLKDSGATFAGWFKSAWDEVGALSRHEIPMDGRIISSLGFSIMSCLALAAAVFLTIFAVINKRSSHRRPGSRDGSWEENTYHPYHGHKRGSSAQVPLMATHNHNAY